MHIYLLKLEQDKYYVGKTDHVDHRVAQHFNQQGSEWTKLYKPISLISSKACESPFDEDNCVKENMLLYGIDNVRGGSYSTIHLTKSDCEVLQKELRGVQDQCLRCGKVGHFINDCKEKGFGKRKRKKIIGCTRCGRNNHKRKDCYAATKLNGDLIRVRK